MALQHMWKSRGNLKLIILIFNFISLKGGVVKFLLDISRVGVGGRYETM